MNKKEIWRYKSLEQLENKKWEPTAAANSGLSQKCLALTKVPLVKLSANELSMLISQSFNPEYLVPLALEILSTDVLITAGLYPGDLLKSVLDVPSSFWEVHHDLHNKLLDLMQARIEEVESELDLPAYWRNSVC
ncbi:hypothetical protein DVR12_15160 [Chitinophaga silvatica]|uniref:Uncharacterized protein n=1 Tax=Chitinophaga silvatica TaxID=2282649 RepID=A0A3E1Y9E7_9BACT|nr:contact-dependent growth inhibition system immunity protein [Chitinophaga silvatica]RFS21981.1 hypothetical protein DVR12_15160 [Chitinophaga silvatica]